MPGSPRLTFPYKIKFPPDLNYEWQDWLTLEIGYWNFDFDRQNIYFKTEEDRVKFILRWS